MNERIKELEIQCWEPRQYGPAWFNSTKFAELIVAEMLKTCEDHPGWSGRMIYEEIKQHFGVEE